MDFSFLALSHSIDMTFKSSTSIDQFLYDFMLLFVKEDDIDCVNHKIKIKILQQNTTELKNRVDTFIDKYKDSNLKVFQLRSYFQKLTEGEYFFIWPGNPLTTEQRIDFYKYLTSLLEGNDYETIKSQMKELFGEIKKVYSISAFDASTKKTIGEQDKSKRVCRFCNNTRTNISFNNIAHAISESLGNKKIILNEECDECNSEFGSASGIESS